MGEPSEKANALTLGELSKRLFFSIVILAVFSLAHADESNSPLLTYENQQYYIESETIRFVTAYNAGDPSQTDDTPCISANGEDLCAALEEGEKRCAANFVPLGASLYVDKIGICRVTDRTNKRYRHRVDIAMPKDAYDKARRFGRQKLNVKVIMPAVYEKYLFLGL